MNSESRWANATQRVLMLSLLVALAGCDSTTEEADAGGPASDSGTPVMDSGTPVVDSGTPEMDSGAPAMDSGTPVTDSGMPAMDAGSPAMDAGSPAMDAGPSSGGATTSAEIAAIRSAADGALTSALSVTDGVVTYVRPAVGSDPAGFFVQAEQVGPAIFVAVDPMTLSTAPDVGDVVSFSVSEVATSAGQKRATMISGYAETGAGFDVSALVQNISSVYIETNLNDYDSELITIEGTLVGSDGGCGTPHRCVQLTTAGVMTASNSLRVRAPDSVWSAVGVTDTCVVSVGPAPLWRYNDAAQPLALNDTELTAVSCNTPTMAGDLVITEVGYEFAGSDDDLEFFEIHNPSTTTALDLNTCVFTDDGTNTLTVSSATIVGPGAYFVVAGSMSEITADLALPGSFGLGGGDAITLTCGTPVIDVVDWDASDFPVDTEDNSIQFGAENLLGSMPAVDNDTGTNWCLTESTSTYGTMGRIGTPGAANGTCVTSAQVVINEVNANIADGCDLVELRVTQGGSMAGYSFQERGSTKFTFDTSFSSFGPNDIIVVHFDGNDPDCRGGVSSIPIAETTSLSEVPSSTVSTNYDTAYDIYITDTGITSTDNVITLLDASGGIMDVVLISDDVTGTAAGSSESAAATAASAGAWTAPDGTVPTGGFVDNDFNANAVQDSNATGTAASGDSLQRNDNMDTNTRDDWTQTASSWGALNAGQS